MNLFLIFFKQFLLLVVSVLRFVFIIIFGPSKPDSAPVRGDGYEPGLRSSDPEPTQRRRTARAGGPGGGCVRHGA